MYSCTLVKIRNDRDFGLEMKTKTRVLSVSVSSYETQTSKNQSQSLFLDQKENVSDSVSKFYTIFQSLILSLTFETEFTKSRSQSKCKKSGLIHPWYRCILAYLHTSILAYMNTCIFLHTFILAYMHMCILAYLYMCILAYLYTSLLAYLQEIRNLQD